MLSFTSNFFWLRNAPVQMLAHWIPQQLLPDLLQVSYSKRPWVWVWVYTSAFFLHFFLYDLPCIITIKDDSSWFVVYSLFLRQIFFQLCTITASQNDGKALWEPLSIAVGSVLFVILVIFAIFCLVTTPQNRNDHGERRIRNRQHGEHGILLAKNKKKSFWAVMSKIGLRDVTTWFIGFKRASSFSSSEYPGWPVYHRELQ